MSGIEKEESEYIDTTKDKLAKENGYDVIRINCEKSELEFIKRNILDSKLSELFDLSKSDWLKAEEFALSNRVKEACDLWNSGVESTKEIGDIMKLSRVTTCKYLKRGQLLNWCNYNPKEEAHKALKFINSHNKKEVEIFKDTISLGVFQSVAELVRESKNLFGIELNSKGISRVCIGGRKHHRGFSFHYTEEGGLYE